MNDKCEEEAFDPLLEKKIMYAEINGDYALASLYESISLSRYIRCIGDTT